MSHLTCNSTCRNRSKAVTIVLSFGYMIVYCSLRTESPTVEIIQTSWGLALVNVCYIRVVGSSVAINNSEVPLSTMHTLDIQMRETMGAAFQRSYLVGPGGALVEPRCVLSSGRAATFGGISSLILSCRMQGNLGPRSLPNCLEEPFPGPLRTRECWPWRS